MESTAVDSEDTVTTLSSSGFIGSVLDFLVRNTSSLYSFLSGRNRQMRLAVHECSRYPPENVKAELLRRLLDLGWKADPASSEELCEAIQVMADLHQTLKNGSGIPPPLHAMLQNGLEMRLLELLQLQSIDVKFLPRSICSDENGVPFYFFAPKVEGGPAFWISGSCASLGSTNRQPSLMLEEAEGYDFLVKRVLLPSVQRGKWFDYTVFASWEGRFVSDTRPAVAVEAEDEHFEIVDTYGIQYFSLSYNAAQKWVLDLSGSAPRLEGSSRCSDFVWLDLFNEMGRSSRVTLPDALAAAPKRQFSWPPESIMNCCARQLLFLLLTKSASSQDLLERCLQLDERSGCRPSEALPLAQYIEAFVVPGTLEGLLSAVVLASLVGTDVRTFPKMEQSLDEETFLQSLELVRPLLRGAEALLGDLCPTARALLQMAPLMCQEGRRCLFARRFCQRLELEDLKQLLKEAPTQDWFDEMQGDFWSMVIDPALQRAATQHFRGFLKVVEEQGSHWPMLSTSLLKACERHWTRSDVSQIVAGVTYSLKLAKGLLDWEVMRQQFALLTAKMSTLRPNSVGTLKQWFEPLKLMENLHELQGGGFAKELLKHSSIHDLLELLSLKVFSAWPFQQLFLEHAQRTCDSEYAQGDRAKLLDEIEHFGDARGCEEIALALLHRLVHVRVLKWQTAIEDEACLRLPAWQHFKHQGLSDCYRQLQNQLQEVFDKLKSLDFTVADCQRLCTGPFQQAARAFDLKLLGYDELQKNLQFLLETKAAFQLFEKVATWHHCTRKRLENVLQDVKRIESSWDRCLACEVLQQCQLLHPEIPNSAVVKALDGSVVIREAVLDEMVESQDLSVPQVLEKIEESWKHMFSSLQSEEITLRNAQLLLHIGDRKHHRISEWLRQELAAARALSGREDSSCDRTRLEADLTALSQLEGYSVVLSDLKIALSHLQQRDLLIEDNDLKDFERQLVEHKNLKWDSMLRDIKQYSKSHVSELEVHSAGAEALHVILQQEPVIQMLAEGDRRLEFLCAKRFGELEVMVRESPADFERSQVAAVHDLADLRPFLVGVLMPEGAHSLRSFIKALKQHAPATPVALLQRAEELLRVVAVLHSDLSKDVRGRDVELFQQMWTGRWVIRDRRSTHLVAVSGSYDLERMKKMRDRLLLDTGTHSRVADLSHLLQVTEELLHLQEQMKMRGLAVPSEHSIQLTGTPGAEIKMILSGFQVDLQEWEQVDLNLRRTYPVLNLFTHSNVQELTAPGLSRRNLEDLLHNARFNLPAGTIDQIQNDLRPPETVMATAWRCLQDFSTRHLAPRVREEASKLHRVATALPNLPRTASPTVPAYLKPGSPNLFFVPEKKLVPSVLSMFHDIQGSMPNARQVLICSGLPPEFQAEHLRLFLLRCLLSEHCLHVLVLPECLSYSAQEYFLSTWRSLLQSLGASAGQKKYLLAMVGCTKDCLPFDAFRAYQQDTPQFSIAQLRRELERRCTLVWSRTPCAGKSVWIEQDIRRQEMRENTVMVNETTGNVDIIGRLRECFAGVRTRSALVLCPSPLVESLEVDILLFRLLVLRQLPFNDGKPFPLQPHNAVTIYLEMPNVLGADPQLTDLGFYSLVQHREVSLDQIWDPTRGELQRAAQILRACRHGGLLDQRVMHAVMHQPVNPHECLRLLREEGPKGSCDTVHMVHFARILCGTFDVAMPLLQQWRHAERNTFSLTQQLSSIVSQSLCTLSRELASRHLLRNSFLEQHWGLLQIPEDRGRSFPLLFDWGLRLVLIPCQGLNVARTRSMNASGLVPITRSGHHWQKSLSKEDKTIWKKVGLEISTYSEFRSCSATEPGEGEVLLNNILGVCGDQNALLTHLRRLRTDPRIKGFALTVDNVMKMAALYIRIKSGVPVVLMGESGCGKSAVVYYLANFVRVPVYTLDVHGGLGEDDVVKFVSAAVAAAFGYPDQNVWGFLDEINTASCVGLFRELVCDHSMRGTKLPENLRIFAACNPYRKKKAWHLTGGLECSVDGDCGEPTPLADLVYAVYPLPQSLIACAWDFGMLSKKEEERYVYAMLKSLPFGAEPRPMRKVMAVVVLACHKFLRGWDVAAVSLRDVSRVAKLTSYYHELKRSDSSNEEEKLLKAFYVSLCLCYWFRLDAVNRKKLLKEVEAELCRAWKGESLSLDDGKWRLKEAVETYWPNLPEIWYMASFIEDLIQQEMTTVMEGLLPLPAGVAANEALRENVFVMIICIDARLPLILVGKPGSSKSLAMQIIRDRFHRETKPTKLSYFPDIAVFPYQCSKHSTAKDIEDRFADAKKFEEDSQDRRGVVFLDEVGLAERSPNLPLKVLHKLLEMPDQQVSFVGLSNWALDAAKMNRCLLLSRGEAEKEELRATAAAILSANGGSLLLEELDRFGLAFMEMCKRLEQAGFGNFVGLRDFYAFIKLLDRSLPSEATSLPPRLLALAVQRSFGGLPKELLNEVILDPFLSYFKDCLGSEMRLEVSELLQTNLSDLAIPERAQVGARHLMVFGPSSATASWLLEEEIGKSKSVTVIMGSSFPGDRSVGAIYQGIAKIKRSMEMGGCVMLVHCEDIYESLYDMLNQFYTRALGRTLCRLAVGAESRQCDVHPAFRCIVVADAAKARSYEAPLLNRFEKQQVDFASFLTQEFSGLVPELRSWVQEVAGISKWSTSAASMAFCGFQEGTIESLLLAAQRHPPKTIAWVKQQLLLLCTPEAWSRFLRRWNTAWKAIQTERFPSLPSSQRSLKAFLAAHSRGHILDWIIYTFTSSDAALNALVPPSWEVQCLKLASISSAEDAKRHIKRFFQSEGTALLVQCILKEGEEVHRMMEHLMRMVAEHRCHHPSKWIIFIGHIVKSQELRLPLHYCGSGFSQALVDELEEPKPWEETVLSHRGGDWQNIVSADLLLETVRKNAWKLATLPVRGSNGEHYQERIEQIQTNRLDLLELLRNAEFKDELLRYSLQTLSHVEGFSSGWQAAINLEAAIKDSDIARAGSFRRAQLRHVEQALTSLVERFLTICVAGSAGRSFFKLPIQLDLWQSALTNEALRTLADTPHDQVNKMVSMEACRQHLSCPFGILWFVALDEAFSLVQDASMRRGLSITQGCQKMREICQDKGLLMPRWLEEDAIRLYGREALLIVAHRAAMNIKTLDLTLLLEVVLSYATSLPCPLGPDVVHFAIEKSWPLLPHISKLGSLRQGRLRQSLLKALPLMATCRDGDFILELVKWVTTSSTTTSSNKNRGSDADLVAQLKEAELFLTATKATGASPSEELKDLLEHEHRNLHFLKLIVCGLVLPLHLDWSCVEELRVTISAMQSRQLQLQELGHLVVSLWPGNEPWYVRATRYVMSRELPKADLTMMRHFLSSTLAQSPGLEQEFGMAMYLALGNSNESLQVQGLKWLESCVGTSLLNTSARIQLARRLLSASASSPDRFSELDLVLDTEFRKHRHGDHQVAATLVLACQEELESKDVQLNDLRCRLVGLHATGLEFIWAMAAARVILVKAARMVKNDEKDIEVAESALELFQVVSAVGPSRRALEVFLVKNLEVDRIELAQLKRRSEEDELWKFLAFPAISDGLPAVSSLGHEICPSDCLMSLLGDEYASLKEHVLSNATISAAGTTSKVMVLFSTSFLGHFNQRNLPFAHQIRFQDVGLVAKLAKAMLQNFPSCDTWQMTPSRTSDWVFMVRPVMHLAARCADAPNSFWHSITTAVGSLRNKHLPFMPGDDFAAAIAAVSATERLGVYECRCGYRYTIGNCTQPAVQVRCPQCRSEIGGRNHEMAAGNRRLQDANDARWRDPGRKGFVDTRDEDDRQTWRSLTVDDLRIGRYFFHGLLSLASALQQPSLCNLSEAAKPLAERCIPLPRSPCSHGRTRWIFCTGHVCSFMVAPRSLASVL